MASVRVFRGVVCHRQFASSRLGSKIAISQKQRSHKGLSTFAVAKDVIPEGRAAPAYTPEVPLCLIIKLNSIHAICSARKAIGWF